MSALTHEHARQFIHHRPHELSASDRAALDLHLAACAACRAYARDLSTLQPILTQAMRARWDSTHSSLTVRRTPQKRNAPRWAMVAALGALIVVAIAFAPSLVPTPAVQPTVSVLPTGAPNAIPGMLALESAGDIFVIRAQGAQVTQHFQAPYKDLAPAWSPDGLRLAFISDRSGRPEVYVQALDSAEATRLTFDPDVADFLPPIAWSPDGSQLAVTVQWNYGDSAQATQIYLIPLTGAEPHAFSWDTGPDRELPHYGQRAPAWSPDGLRLAFISRVVSNDRVLISNPQSSTPQFLSVDEWMDETAFAWSPDGKGIAFIALGPGEGGVYVAQLSIAGLDGSAPRVILTQTVTGAPVYQTLRWSPEGARLLFTAADEKGVEQMYLLYRDGSSLTHLGVGAAPQFSSDGRWIVYARSDAVYALNVEEAFRAPQTLKPVYLMEGVSAQWQPAPPAAVVPAVTPAPSASALQLLGVHSVQEGESARCIAAAYGISLTALIEVNQLGEPPQLPSGALLVPAVPDDGTTASRFCAPQFSAPGAMDAPTTPAFDPLPFALSENGVALNAGDCVLAGRVLSRAGAPLAGLLVHISGPEMERDVLVGDSGFAMPLTQAGAYRVRLVNVNGLPLSDDATIDVVCGATLEFVQR